MDFPEEEKKSLNFIEAIIEEDLTENKNEGRVHTRFPLNQMVTFILAMPNPFV